jgi:hypothetical protein
VNEFEDLQKRVFALYADGRFAEMPELLDGAVDRFRNWRSRITYWQACMDSLLGEPERALGRLRRGAPGHLEGSGRRGRGYWWVECGTCECGWQVPHYAESVG